MRRRCSCGNLGGGGPHIPDGRLVYERAVVLFGAVRVVLRKLFCESRSVRGVQFPNQAAGCSPFQHSVMKLAHSQGVQPRRVLLSQLQRKRIANQISGFIWVFGQVEQHLRHTLVPAVLGVAVFHHHVGKTCWRKSCGFVGMRHVSPRANGRRLRLSSPSGMVASAAAQVVANRSQRLTFSFTRIPALMPPFGNTACEKRYDARSPSKNCLLRSQSSWPTCRRGRW